MVWGETATLTVEVGEGQFVEQIVSITLLLAPLSGSYSQIPYAPGAFDVGVGSVQLRVPLESEATEIGASWAPVGSCT